MNTARPDATKYCRACKQLRPAGHFPTRRHRRCYECVRANIEAGLKPNAMHGRAGITTTATGYNEYQRKMKRLKAPKRLPPRELPENKLCMQCRKVKPLAAFGTWRIRICLECDGPTIDGFILPRHLKI